MPASLFTAENAESAEITEFNPSPRFEDFNYNFYLRFIAFLERKEYSYNYIGAIIKGLKIILNNATKEGINTNEEFRKFEVPTEDVYNIYYNKEELEIS